jgi:hypothetical protein
MEAIRDIVRLLADWRASIRRTGDTQPWTVERDRAERVQTRAQWAYEDESLRQHAAHGLPESAARRMNRLDRRSAAMQSEHRRARDRVAGMADAAEISRELGE